ncbi:lysoplasmalogenase TMEM86A-like [Artemia franciscana]|uniref:lysoplasmalogenase TMEM86A-like n=1 Tax=Artemia franciscana TaxID=6661 RepID=UPI0032DA9C17
MDRSISIKMLPFASLTMLFFAKGMDKEIRPELKAVYKCLPVCYLIYYAISNLKDSKKSKDYSKKIATGLVLSVIGDACIVWPKLFIPGALAYILAHGAYASSFGWKPLFLKTGIVLYSVVLTTVSAMVTQLSTVLILAIIIYALLLTTMLWRAFARYIDSPNLWKLSALSGALLFLTSDIIFGIHLSYFQIPHAEFVIMAIYYGAQLCIALSCGEIVSLKKEA